MECYILAGGQSRRFGQDKTLFPILGKPTISHVVERLSLVCSNIFLVCKDKNKYTFLEEVKLIEEDQKERFALIGIYNVLKAARGEKVIILSADMPFIKPHYISLLYRESKPPVTLFKVGQRLHPFPGVYYKTLRKKLDSYIRLKDRRVIGFLEEVGYNYLRIEKDSLTFLNINTQEDINISKRCIMEKTIKVEGMKCEHCAQTVKKALFELEGVSHVDVDIQSGEVKVFLEEDVPFESMKGSIEKWGYSVTGEV